MVNTILQITVGGRLNTRDGREEQIFCCALLSGNPSQLLQGVERVKVNKVGDGHTLQRRSAPFEQG